MSYFKVFPRVAYPYNANGDRKNSVNIIKRFTFADYIKTNADIYVKYQMSEADTFQSLSKKLYGSPDLHWILYLMNDISDPFTQLPKTSAELALLIANKYPGNVLMLDIDTFGGDFVEGETITSGSYSAVVTSWDATYRKLVVSSELNVSGLGETITGSTSGSTATVKRRMDNALSVHHFEDGFGNILNPLPNPLDATGDSPLDGYLDQAEQPNITIITNTEYEILENDAKKKIKILRVELKEQILSELGSIFK